MLQLAGLWMAIATFLAIWWGHVGVRWIEAHSRNIRLPMSILIVGGVGLIGYSLFTPDLTSAGVSSIVGITFFWDAFELVRQQKRVIKGHARANPHNPRHAAYLAAPHSHAVVVDPLDREPLDSLYMDPSPGSAGRYYRSVNSD